MDRLIVKASGSYPIIFDTLASCGEHIAPLVKGEKIAVISDDIVSGFYMDKVTRTLAEKKQIYSYVLANGESSKSIENLQKIYAFLAQNNIGRYDGIVALGGGVVGDITGFAAATYMRGVDYFQIPTTLLAQVDSSVGGKTAVNLPEGKNLVGAFYQPKAVIIDSSVLATLPTRQLAAGWAEVIKYGCIYDADFFDKLIKSQTVTDDIIRRCCEIKAEFVRLDEFDFGARMALNFGHTLGHQMESQCGYGTFLHGEAVAIGMVSAAKLGENLGVTPQGTHKVIKQALQDKGLPTDIPSELSVSGWHDKKAKSDKLTVVLLEKLGKYTLRELSGSERKQWEENL